MPEVVIFDYGVGNLLSLKTALEKAGLAASIGTTWRGYTITWHLLGLAAFL
jgi:imidazoleglycerol phosphate synthase glutamine amidotransferase subunit HisH